MSIRGMNQATVTMNQLQQQMDMIGSNMSNSSTTGYKSKQAEFSSLLFQQINNMNDPRNATGRVTPNGIRAGTGARLGAIHADTRMGSFQETDRDLDVALLKENHFFEVENRDDADNTVRFTRDGTFYLQPSANGASLELVTKDGHGVVGSDGDPISFAAGNIDGIQIQSNGTIMVQRGQQYENVGKVSVVSIDNPRVLEADGDNYYRLANPAESGVGYGDIVDETDTDSELMQSRTLEMSNVDIADQMTSLINAQRSYQFNARALTMADEMQGLINQVR